MNEKEIKELDKKFEKMSKNCANGVWRGTGSNLKPTKKTIKKTTKRGK